MICNTCIRSVIAYGGISARSRSQLSNIRRSLHFGLHLKYKLNFQATMNVSMMMDSGSTENQGPIGDVLQEKDNDGGYISGGWKSDDCKLSCGYSSIRGKRATMEDRYDVKKTNIDGKTVCLFGIFDGHGGSRAAEYLKEHLFDNLLKHPQFMQNTKLAINETYQKTDGDFLESEKDTYRDDGSTASTAVLVDNHLYVANVGDSRTVISKAGKAIPLSEDHKPNRSDERKRIESAGGVVMWAGTWRVGGVLAMSRAFGNRMLKQFVVAEPEIQEQQVDEELELLMLASDGLWDVISNEDAVSLSQTEDEPEAAARKLTEAAFTRGSADNITCIVVKFHHARTGERTHWFAVNSSVMKFMVTRTQRRKFEQQLVLIKSSNELNYRMNEFYILEHGEDNQNAFHCTCRETCTNHCVLHIKAAKSGNTLVLQPLHCLIFSRYRSDLDQSVALQTRDLNYLIPSSANTFTHDNFFFRKPV